jgi:hypothetical protein
MVPISNPPKASTPKIQPTKIGTTTGIYINVWNAPDGVTYYKFFNLIHQDLRRFHFFTDSSTFYQFVSDDPQGKMEQRSVNILVRRLIGDDHFEW